MNQSTPFPHIVLRDWLLYLYALACPFFVFSLATGRDMPAHWIMALLLVVMLLDIIANSWRLRWDSSETFLLVLLGIYMISSLYVMAQGQANTWAGRTPEERALGINVRWGVAILSLIVLVHHLRNVSRDTLLIILQLQLLVGAVIALFGLIQFALHTFFGVSLSLEPTNKAFELRSNVFRIGKEKIFRASSIYSEPSYLGFYLLPLFVKALVLFRKKVLLLGSNIIHLICLMILLFGLITNFSLTAILSGMFLVLIAGILRARESPVATVATLGIIIALLVVLLLSPWGGLFQKRIERLVDLQDLSTLARFFSGYVGIVVFLQNPLLGVGPGGFAFKYPEMGIFVDKQLMHTPLNIWLSVLTDVGIVGFIPFAAFWWSVVRRSSRLRTEDPLVSAQFWVIVCLILLLTTVDLWYLDLVWFEISLLLTLVVRKREREDFHKLDSDALS